MFCGFIKSRQVVHTRFQVRGASSKGTFPRSLSPFPLPSYLSSSSSPAMFPARRAVAFLGFALCFLLQNLFLWLCLVDFREHGWPSIMTSSHVLRLTLLLTAWFRSNSSCWMLLITVKAHGACCSAFSTLPYSLARQAKKWCLRHPDSLHRRCSVSSLVQERSPSVHGVCCSDGSYFWTASRSAAPVTYSSLHPEHQQTWFYFFKSILS